MIQHHRQRQIKKIKLMTETQEIDEATTDEDDDNEIL